MNKAKPTELKIQCERCYKTEVVPFDSRTDQARKLVYQAGFDFVTPKYRSGAGVGLDLLLCGDCERKLRDFQELLAKAEETFLKVGISSLTINQMKGMVAFGMAEANEEEEEEEF